MRLNGWIRTSLIDYPEHIATVLFTGGCNFRCPMCHNADLVLRPAELDVFPEDTVWQFLEKRAGKITGVVITGGEPTLQPDLGDFLRRVRNYGYAVKLDTNGYRPDVLASLLASSLLDYVAMDIKSPPEKYAQLAGLPGIDIDRIARSVVMLQASAVAHEFRTTVVPGLLDSDDVEAIARWLLALSKPSSVGECADVPAPALYLQQFRGLGTLDPALTHVSPYPIATLHAMANRARHYLPHVQVRGG